MNANENKSVGVIDNFVNKLIPMLSTKMIANPRFPGRQMPTSAIVLQHYEGSVDAALEDKGRVLALLRNLPAEQDLEKALETLKGMYGAPEGLESIRSFIRTSRAALPAMMSSYDRTHSQILTVHTSGLIVQALLPECR